MQKNYTNEMNQMNFNNIKSKKEIIFEAILF